MRDVRGCGAEEFRDEPRLARLDDAEAGRRRTAAAPAPAAVAEVERGRDAAAVAGRARLEAAEAAEVDDGRRPSGRAGTDSGVGARVSVDGRRRRRRVLLRDEDRDEDRLAERSVTARRTSCCCSCWSSWEDMAVLQREDHCTKMCERNKNRKRKSKS